MKFICLILALTVLFCGCAPAQPLPTAPATAPSSAPTTAATEPAATLPADPLEAMLAEMTSEEKVGQLFLARCPDTDAITELCNYHLGGYILFGRDFAGQTPLYLTKTLAVYQASAKIPLLIAVDEEGGTVCRVSSNSAFRERPFPSPRSLYAKGGLDSVLAAEEEKAELLSTLGINVNMAPVCDITTDSRAFMYSRSLGESPEITGDFVAGTVDILSKYGVGSVLKHFPGYGNNADTHTGIAVDRRELAELEAFDLIPFAAGIQAGCDAILVSHTIVNALDETMPASLSPAVHAYLRENMGFEGVIVTDDLVMQAITDAYGAEEAAVLAVLAGNDLLCSTEYPVQYRSVLEAVEQGRIPREMLDNAVLRILRWKQELGLLASLETVEK